MQHLEKMQKDFGKMFTNKTWDITENQNRIWSLSKTHLGQNERSSKNTQNLKVAGIDTIPIFWFKELKGPVTILFLSRIPHNDFTEHPGYETKSRSILLCKSTQIEIPKNSRQMTFPNKQYKTLTSILATKIRRYVKNNNS